MVVLFPKKCSAPRLKALLDSFDKEFAIERDQPAAARNASRAERAAVAFLLDTYVCICLINRRPGHVPLLECVSRYAYGDVLILAVTMAELEFGVAKNARGAGNRNRLDLFLARFELEYFDGRAAAAYGPLRARLEARGLPIGPPDTLLAAQALASGATLVTNNTREFREVSGLKLENWLC